MKSWDDFLSEEPGNALDARVIASVQRELDQLRAKRRRTFFAWLTPITLGAVGLITWRRSADEMAGSAPNAADSAAPVDLMAEIEREMSSLNEESFAILEDFELYDDLEVLEQWNPTKS